MRPCLARVTYDYISEIFFIIDNDFFILYRSENFSLLFDFFLIKKKSIGKETLCLFPFLFFYE